MLVKLEEHCEFLGGFAFKSQDLKEIGGIPVVKIKNVNNKVVTLNDVQYFSQTKLTDKLRKFLLNDGDVLIAMTGQGSVGRVGRFSNPSDSYVLLNQRVGKFLPKKTLDLGYLYYILSSEQYEKELFNAATGSGQPNLSPDIIRGIKIPYIPKMEQVKVSTILGNLDNKIELNRQTNQTLEQMAQTLFKSWFVDFDPVFDNLLAKANYQLTNLPADFPEELRPKAVTRLAALSARIPTQEHENEKLASIHDRDNAPLPHHDFPSEFEFNEQLGWVPLGWENKTIKDFGKVVTGKTPPKNVQDAYHSQGSPFITPTDIDESVFIIETNRRLSESGQFSVKNNKIIKNSICVTCIGSQMGKTVIAPFDSYTNQQINSVILHSSFTKSYLFTNLRNRREEIFAQGSSGSTMPILNKSSFEKLSVLSPNDESLKKFDVVVSSYLDGILQRSIQNKELTKLRDTLLPKLISGELQIPDLEPRSHALRDNA